MLHLQGFRVKGAHIGELGPGDSLGIGLAALLSGASSYIGLDIVPFSANTNLEKILDDLVQLYLRREAIPDQNEFPFVLPRLISYEFPTVLAGKNLTARSEKIRDDLRKGVNSGHSVNYQVPWNRSGNIAKASLDLVFSQAVLEHVDDLDETYRAMFLWLKPGGYASHVIGFVSHRLAPTWNGHWAFSDLEWRLVRGRREFLLNREPLSTHLQAAKRAGFELLSVAKECATGGLNVSELAAKYQCLNVEDATTCGVTLIMRKP